jgi:hypothetical protein
MRIPFDIKCRPQIESGEYKVVTGNGEPVEIVKWDCRGKAPILAVIFDGDTDDSCLFTEQGCTISEKKWLYMDVGEPKWRFVDEDNIYINEPVVAHRKNAKHDDVFRGYVVCADHTLTKEEYDKYIYLKDLEGLDFMYNTLNS